MLLCIGGNDFLRRLGARQAEANVRAMVKLARGRGIEVLLIGTPEPGFSLSPPAFYAGIAKEFHLPYENAVVAEVLGTTGSSPTRSIPMPAAIASSPSAWPSG